VQFSDLLAQNFDQKAGPITAAIAMDDKFILFTRRKPYYVVGTGPAPNGANSDFTDPVEIAADTGCNNRKSVIVTPIGVIFQSDNGIYVLDRSLQVSYIGADVETFNNAMITSAQLIPGLTQVRFTLDTGVTLVYDYFMKQWSERIDMNASDSTIFQNKFTFIGPSGQLVQETPSGFTDSGNFIQLELETGWMNFAGVQGFQRVREFLILGEYKSTHTLQVQFAYDFGPYVDTVNVTPDPSLKYQYRVFLPRQKMEALKIKVTELQPSGFGQGLSLSNFAFEVGVKKGLNKMPAAQSFG